MVKPFQFSRLPKIYFRNGVIGELPKIIKQYGNTIILVAGKSSFLNSRSAEKLFHDFKDSGIGYNLLVVPGEPSPENIDDAVRTFRGINTDLIVAIGGGSVIDAGKAISAMMNRSEPVAEFLEGIGTLEHPGTKLPFIAVPTTSGTGSEATKNAVISRIGKEGFKRSLRHDNFVPDIALVDPELTWGCPKDITASSGMDCFTQLTEAYLSEKSNLYTDALALEGLREIKVSLKRSFIDGSDSEARSGMSFAALTSGICLANAGLGVVHGFASSIGGMYDIPHGLICGTFMAKSNEINIRALRKTGKNPVALKKYATLGKLFIDDVWKNDDYFIDGFIDYLHQLSGELQLTRLNIPGFKEQDLEVICQKTDIKNNPVALTVENLKEIVSSLII
jgi:alcohol dehydrogenase class IV